MTVRSSFHFIPRRARVIEDTNDTPPEMYAMIATDGDMPPPTPLAMPVQRLDVAPITDRQPSTAPDDMLARRLLLIMITLVLAVAAGTEIRVALMRDGLDLWDGAILALFFPLFAWISFGFCGSAIGLVLLMTGQYSGLFRDRSPVTLPKGRTAILMPIHNEDVDAVFRRIEAMLNSIAAIGAESRFSFFVLSDSGIAAFAAEHAAFRALRGRSRVPLHYRRRLVNHGRKPGNVAEWVESHGAAYDYMMVLDADSLVSGPTMSRLAVAMDRYPGVGLLQTVPIVVNGGTLFARWQQFASRLYGPLATAGLMWWSGSEATFWGHNAIIRTCAFAESCGLPVLSGREPFGGHILSHDMVEAALLRRRGWAVHMVMMDESYEEYPPTPVDHAIRDRRWCQGNLQHLRLLDSAGFRWVNRLQLLIGASAYLTSPLWLLLLLTAAVAQIRDTSYLIGIAPSGWILALTVLLLFGPKLMATGWALADRERRAAFGGGGRIVASVAVEIPLSILMAPAAMLTQTLAVIDILRGRKTGWAPQTRESRGIPLDQALRHYRPHLMLGGLFGVLGLADPVAALWMLPVTGGLLAAPFLAAFTSRLDLGLGAREWGLFLTPEELRGAGDARFATSGGDPVGPAISPIHRERLAVRINPSG